MKDISLLLVDDEEDFRRTIAKRLSRRGMAPREASNGEECLALMAEDPAEVVVLDVRMPGRSGIEVLRRIRSTYPATEVILLTGYASTEDGVEGIKLGAFDYLTKPMKLEHLISKIQQAHEKILREEEKKKEAEFRAKLEQQMIATERLASLGTLAAGVAHEINNPLAIIQEAVGWMSTLLQKEDLKDMPRKEDFDLALEKIKKGIDRTKRITHQLLGFVRKVDANVSEINITELVQETVELVSLDSGNRTILILGDLDAKQDKVYSDAYQLRQVLINLLSNAVQATQDDGTIEVRLSGAGDQVTLEVKDDGEGIPGENLQRIFEPFFSTKTTGQGTGLGLFVSRGIIEKLGGTIHVESRLGHGACFLVTLPRIRGEATLLEPEGDGDVMDMINKCRTF